MSFVVEKIYLNTLSRPVRKFPLFKPAMHNACADIISNVKKENRCSLQLAVKIIFQKCFKK